MSLRVAFDLDGVLADMDGALVCQAEVVFGEAMTKRLRAGASDDTATASTESIDTSPDTKSATDTAPVDTPSLSKLDLTARQERRLWRHVEAMPNFWETLSEIESGAVAHLAKLATDRRWEVIFLTKRPETAGSTAQVQSQRWLESKGFPLPSVYVVRGSRGRIAESLALDIVVDDRLENCLDVVIDSKARALLVWREDEQQLPASAKRLGVGIVKSVSECLTILTQVDGTDGAAPGVMNRVMRLLGLKEPATA